MASQLLNVTRSLSKLSLSTKCRLSNALIKLEQEVPTQPLFGNSVRSSTNFFNKLPANDLWKGITSVSNAGKKRGRAKTVSKKNIKDLNRGQVIGVGKANILWPGLTAPIIRGKEVVEQQQLPEDPERQKRLNELRDQMGSHRYAKLSPIERGWSGAKMPGRSIGPPDPIGEDTFVGFDSKVLELKTVFNMKGNFGRKRRVSATVVTGNKNGVAGFSMGKGVEPRTALRKAKNRAGQKLMHVKIFRNHTVYHDFFTQFGATKIYVWQKPEGYGLVGHRAIKTICEVVGIKDLHAKVEGSTTVNHVMKAFFLGLVKQKTHEEIAAEKSLHLVEFKKENGYFPTVLASPPKCKTEDEIKKDEILDFTQYCFDGRVILNKKKYPPFYTQHKSYQIYLKKQEKLRNKQELKLNLISEYGEIKSFLTQKYPECRPQVRPKKEEAEEESNA
ncbi:hypothetical protein MTP99_000248 [Tenebrio molitor]|jgi:small subunit ribosomal protein S5|uniref:small ribosomal subunit protein uS5m n=1 Tax=Tenebrio molitor TaxID=7067 RepID=UPI0026F5CE9C|nr:hypothetical protein MTP99_000248 [Tenebrio molitor]